MWRHVCWRDDDARGYGGGDDDVSYQDRLPQPPALPGPTSPRVPVALAPEAGLVPRVRSGEANDDACCRRRVD